MGGRFANRKVPSAAATRGNGDLYDAVRLGDLGAVVFLVGQASPQTTTSSLILAIRLDRRDLFEALRAGGPDLNAVDEVTGKPVWFHLLPKFEPRAATDVSVIGELFDEGANPAAVDGRGDGAVGHLVRTLPRRRGGAPLINSVVEAIRMLVGGGCEANPSVTGGESLLEVLARRTRFDPELADTIARVIRELGGDNATQPAARPERLAPSVEEVPSDAEEVPSDAEEVPSAASEPEAGLGSVIAPAPSAEATARHERFLKLGEGEQWSEVIEALETVYRDTPEDPRVCLYGAYALAQDERFDDAVLWAERGLELAARSPDLVEVLFYALVNQERYGDVIERWQAGLRHSLDLTHPSTEYIVAHLLVAYIHGGRAADGVVEVVPVVAQLPGLDAGTVFNAACLCALAGRASEALRFVWAARKLGYDRERFDSDSDFDRIRDDRGFQTLLAAAPEGELAAMEHMVVGALASRSQVQVDGDPKP